jgi:hypothetical protein
MKTCARGGTWWPIRAIPLTARVALYSRNPPMRALFRGLISGLLVGVLSQSCSHSGAAIVSATPQRDSPVGSGALGITLTWNTTADIDLHVLEPTSAHVFYANRTGPTARLDVDDTNGFTPENIFVEAGRAAAGVYQVYINHFGGSPTTSTITITLNTGAAGAITRTFTRTTTNSARIGNVANVNVLTGQITETTGIRAPDEHDDDLTAPKNAPEK